MLKQMKETVLLTGATGFVGRQVLRALPERNISVRVIVRTGREHTFEPHGLDRIFATEDLFAERPDWFETVLRGIHTVVHTAWYTNPADYLVASENLSCLSGTLELARRAAAAGVHRYIGIGTCFEYDLSAGLLSIDTPLRPVSPYAGAKAAAYLALSNWLPRHNVEFAWCRLFYLFGEGEHPSRLVPYLRNAIQQGVPARLTSGNQIRDYLDVRDAAKMIVAVALSDIVGPVNICSGVPITVRQLAERVADEYGRRDLLQFGKRPENVVDPACVVGVRTTKYGT